MSERIETKVQAMYAEGAKLHPLVELTRRQWAEKYKPGPRLALGNPTDALVRAALDADPRTVWTELNTGQRTVIVNGWCYVNREAYYITAVPFSDMLDDIEVTG